MIISDITYSQRLKELCNNVDVVLDFLPPYSPDFNPIEEAFAELKAWMRKNNQLQSAFETFEGFLEAGLNYMSNKTGNHFRSCYITMPEDDDNEEA